ncbi:Kit ligand isoform X2 [Aix galericulata]|nr:Kit ligand isoform X2 [Aix galericulata]
MEKFQQAGRIGCLAKKEMDQCKPNHCWLHLMVPEFSRSLHSLLQKFSDISDMSDVLSNYSIINNLTRIINDLMACLAFDKNKDFIKENGHLYEEHRFFPEQFFEVFNSTIEVYKEFADTLDKNDCILPSTVETPENESLSQKQFCFLLLLPAPLGMTALAVTLAVTKTHPKSRSESDETTECHGCQEENEIRLAVMENHITDWSNSRCVHA